MGEHTAVGPSDAGQRSFEIVGAVERGARKRQSAYVAVEAIISETPDYRDPDVTRANRLAARNAALSEEIGERGVIEQVVRLDDLCLSQTGNPVDISVIELRVNWFLVGWGRPMALPA
jgi:hypothetical protein